MKKIIILLTASFALLSEGFAQKLNRDSSVLYILYDVSGSMTSDVNSNSFEALKLIIARIKLSKQYTVIFFGHAPDIKSQLSGKISYSTNEDPLVYTTVFESVKKEQEKFKKALDTIQKLRTGIRFTDINDGLEKLKNRLPPNVFNGAAIIVSDGILAEGDVPPSYNYQAYLNETDKRIQELEKLIPIYFVQTSTSKGRDFYHVQSEDKIDADPSVFFIGNEKELRTDGSLRTLFDDFLRRVVRNLAMRVQPKKFLRADDHIASIFVLSKLIEMYLDKKITKEKLNQLIGDTTFLATMESAIKVDSISKSRIKAMGDSIKNWQKHKNIGENFGLIGQEALRDAVTAVTLKLPSKIADPILIPAEMKNTREAKNLEEAWILGLADYLIDRVEKEVAFVYYETLNDELFGLNSFIRDTLFLNTSKLFQNLEQPPSVPVIRESFVRDLNSFTDNLVKYPIKRNSQGLIFLKFALATVAEINKGKDIESAIEQLEKKYIEKDRRNISDFEKGIVFVSRYFQYLNQHNLLELFPQLSFEEQKRITIMVVALFSSDYEEISVVRNIEQLTKDLVSINEKISLIRKELNYLTSKITQPQADYQGYQNMVRQESINFLRNAISIIKEGVKLTGNFSEKPFNDINGYLNTADCVADAYFLILDKKYIPALTCLIPVIYDLTYKPNPSVLKKKIEVNTASVSRGRGDNKVRSLVYKVSVSKKNYIKQIGLDVKKIAMAKRALLIFESGVDEILKPTNDPLSRYRLAIDTLGIKYIGDFLYTDNFVRDKVAVEKRVQLLLNLLDIIKTGVTLTPKTLEICMAKVAEFGNRTTETLLSSPEFAIFLNWLDLPDLKPELKKLVELAGEVSTATTAKDVKNLISGYALPEASYRIKRKSEVTWMINAYVGVGATYFASEKQARSVISAPIGFEFSFRPAKELTKLKRNVSIMVSLIDVGNVINYRISNSSTDQQFRIQQIVSPGLIAYWPPFIKLPLALGIGYQTNPSRFAASISFDLPLFRLDR